MGSSEIEFGRYRLVKRLAAGGMAEIWLAKQKGPAGFEKHLVIKRILAHLAMDEDFVRMFLDEARLAAQLTHPNVVQVNDFGEVEESYYLAMELVRGPDLRRLLRACKKADIKIPYHLAARVMSQALAGLDYAHKAVDSHGDPLNIIHRDVSPQNILVSMDGNAKLVDFGIAKAVTQSQHTMGGVVKGKFAYMPPEQMRGETLDCRADVYAAGLVLYELVTGEQALQGEGQAAMMNALEGKMRPVTDVRPDLPNALVNIIETACARDRLKRYPDAAAMEAALETYLMRMGKPVTSRDVAEFLKGVQIDSGDPLTFAGTGSFSRPDIPVANPGAQNTRPAAKAPRPAPQPAEEVAPSPAEAERTIIAEKTPLAAPRQTKSQPAVAAPSHAELENQETVAGMQSPFAQAAAARAKPAPALEEAEDATMPGDRPAPRVPPPRKVPPPRAAPRDIEPEEEQEPTNPPDDMDATLQRSAKPKWVVPAVIGVVALLGVGGFLATRGGSAPADAKQQEPVAVKETPKVDEAPPKDGPAAEPAKTEPVVAKAEPPKEEPKPEPKAEPVKEEPKPEPKVEVARVEAKPEPKVAAKEEKKPSFDGLTVEKKPKDVKVARAEKTEKVARQEVYVPPPPPPSGGSGLLSVASQPWTQVTIDGAPAGQTPLLKKSLSAGAHKVRLENPEMGLVKELTVEVAAGEEKREVVKFAKGKLTFVAVPWGEVKLGSKTLGQTPLPAQEVFEGTYTVTASNPETGKTVTKQVTVKAGEEQKVKLDLR